VLATFGLILFFNDLVRMIWGPAGKSIAVPPSSVTPMQILPGVPTRPTASP
jgi:branched-chain amino acid transport system permease protein